MKKLIGARGVGFTLIELMLVVAIIGLLAAIAIPKFASLVIRAKEAATKGKLGAVRSAISIYYADNDGSYPTNQFGVSTMLQYNLVPKYLDEIPGLIVPTVPQHNGANYTTNTGISDGSFFGAMSNGYYFNLASGQLVVNCTHTDSRGSTWSLW